MYSCVFVLLFSNEENLVTQISHITEDKSIKLELPFFRLAVDNNNKV